MTDDSQIELTPNEIPRIQDLPVVGETMTEEEAEQIERLVRQRKESADAAAKRKSS